MAKRSAQRARRARCEVGKPAHFVYLLNHVTLRYKRISLQCKQRGCKVCSVGRRLRVTDRVNAMAAAVSGKVTFFTLTCKRLASLEDEWREASSMWAKFWRKLKKKLKGLLKGVDYAWVLEPHRDGRVHLHAVVAVNFIWYRLVQKLWNDVGGGNTRVSPKPDLVGTTPGKYVGKYVGKFGRAGEQLLTLLTESRVRIYNSSHRFKKVKPIPTVRSWTARLVSWEGEFYFVRELKADGWQSG